jgi:hypothetical protein
MAMSELHDKALPQTPFPRLGADNERLGKGHIGVNKNIRPPEWERQNVGGFVVSQGEIVDSVAERFPASRKGFFC